MVMTMTLFNARVFTPLEVIERGSIVVSEGRIAFVGRMEDAPQVDGERMDVRGKIVAPGFIDIHVHGGNGVTFLSNDINVRESLQAYSTWVASTGVTGFLCGLCAPGAEAFTQMVSRFVSVLGSGLQGAEALGLFLEGPFLSPEKKGAFDPAYIRPPDMKEAERLLEVGQGWIRQITMAPENPGAQEVAALFREAGVVVSMGHTNADGETASAALRESYTHVTHTFNAQRGFHHRAPGVVGAVMTSDEATAELIADTMHVHPTAMKLMVRCIGVDRVVLITDAEAWAGLADGTYDLMGRKVYVEGGCGKLADGTLTGGRALLCQCVRTMNQEVGVSLIDSVKMASLNPARAMGFTNRLGSISPNKAANLIVIDEDVNVDMTMVRGRIVYRNTESVLWG